ncbi:uncharacterized protein LOC116188967 [Punica granatum]|uniref:Uncharacterized protein LOC116188967 n=1 Tax=Punica granatum TaxID=22663 RepID=A0A6P8BVC5_PUNGR|nr:uncharacterized protein LOC116188967 [Punica granatum]
MDICHGSRPTDLGEPPSSEPWARLFLSRSGDDKAGCRRCRGRGDRPAAAAKSDLQRLQIGNQGFGRLEESEWEMRKMINSTSGWHTSKIQIIEEGIYGISALFFMRILSGMAIHHVHVMNAYSASMLDENLDPEFLFWISGFPNWGISIPYGIHGEGNPNSCEPNIPLVDTNYLMGFAEILVCPLA